jgi:hypothetical protein
MPDVLHHIVEENKEEHHEVTSRNHNYLHRIDHLFKKKNNINISIEKRIRIKSFFYFDDEVLNY